MDDHECIAKEVWRFRRACEQYARLGDKDAPEMGCFGMFPDGMCLITSWMLAQHLVERGIVSYARMAVISSASVPTGGTHAWLEVDGLVVDITADQFAGRDVCVLRPHCAWYRSMGGNHERLSQPLFRDDDAGLARLRAIQAHCASEDAA